VCLEAANCDKFSRLAGAEARAAIPARPAHSNARRADSLGRLLGAGVPGIIFGGAPGRSELVLPRRNLPTHRPQQANYFPAREMNRSPAKKRRRAQDPEKWIFLDTETTARRRTGTYAFLIGRRGGCGRIADRAIP